MIDIPLERGGEDEGPIRNQDVAIEENRVREQQFPSDAPIVVFDLKKTYPKQAG